MVLKWIPATSEEVEIIGDSRLLGGCTLLFPQWLVVCLDGLVCLSVGHNLHPQLNMLSGVNAKSDQLWL